AGAQEPPAEARVGAMNRIAKGGALRLQQQPSLADCGEPPEFLALAGRRLKCLGSNSRKAATGLDNGPREHRDCAGAVVKTGSPLGADGSDLNSVSIAGRNANGHDARDREENLFRIRPRVPKNHSLSELALP